MNPVAVAAMAEEGIDLAAETPDAAVGLRRPGGRRRGDDGLRRRLPVLPGTRYGDWQLDHAAGQPLDVVRPIRDVIRRRVEALVAELVDDQPAAATDAARS